MLHILALAFAILTFGAVALYNRRLMVGFETALTRAESGAYRVLGRHIRRMNLKMSRSASLDRKSSAYRLSRYFNEIIVNLDMGRDNVTPFGLMTFIVTTALSGTIVFVYLSGNVLLGVPAFAALLYLVLVLFRFVSLLRFERKESDIMDAVDLICMDIKGGVQNAVTRYSDSFHPRIAPYFKEFLYDIQENGFSFKESMLLLEQKLGRSFTSFAQKAIQYEAKADDTMNDIFSQIIETNRHVRTLRYENNVKFAMLRMNFLVSFGIIMAYVLFTVSTDVVVKHFLLDTTFGNLLIILDIALVAYVVAYIASLKAKFL